MIVALFSFVPAIFFPDVYSSDTFLVAYLFLDAFVSFCKMAAISHAEFVRDGLAQRHCLIMFNKRFFVAFILILLGLFSQYAYAQEETDEDYEYADCGLIIDDSSDAPCFEIVAGGDEWQPHPQKFGYNGGSLYAPMRHYHKIKWVPSYKDLKKLNNGKVEVFISLPPSPCEENSSDTANDSEASSESKNDVETDCELSEKVDYVIRHKGGEDTVTVNHKEKAGQTVPLGAFEFDGEEAWVELDDLHIHSDAYQLADAVCFGAACPTLMDITPPKIEDVKTKTHYKYFVKKDTFYIEAKITDEGTGVASAVVEFNGETYQMKAKGDIYSTTIPYKSGIDLKYMIVATDGAGNVGTWDPVRGYVIRGAGRQLGIPPWALYRLKRAVLGVSPAARPGSSACSAYGCDPVNMMTGNLLEQLVLANLPGRPAIELVLTHNSQGGEQTIFGESWVHNYNSRLTEMDNADFQGVFAQYPDGRTVMFEGPSFTPEPGIYDKLERDGDGFKLTQQDKTVLYFDNYGDLTRQEDANGNGVTLTYSEQTKFVNLSKIASIKADGGREITFEYNDKGLVTKINLPEEKTIGIEYNDTDDLTAVIDGSGGRTVYEYQNHAISKKISPEGHAYYENTYDDQRRVTKQVAGTSWTQTMTYADDQTVVTDKNGAVFTYFYNADGIMISNVDESGKRTSFEYDAQQKVIAETNAEGKRYEYRYDERGNQIYQKDPLSYEVTREFDATFNKPLYEKNENGAETRYEYDGKGNLTKITNAAGNSMTFAYDQYGQLIAATDFNGNKTTYTYTAAGDLESETDALGNVTTFLYDGLGRLMTRTNPRGVRFYHKYDGNDHLVEVMGPLGYHVAFVYDRNGRLVKQTDPKGAEISFEYDQSENLTAHVNELGFRTAFEYGAMNEKLRMIDPEGRVTQYAYTPTYDIAEIRAAAGTAREAVTQSEYNGLRIPVKIVDPEGRVTLLEYDNLFRLVKVIEDANGLAIVTRYEYNPTGQIVKETDANGNATEYALDALDRIISKTDAEGQITRFEYDAQGNLVNKTNPRGFATMYEYDALNRLVKATDAKNGVTTFAYDASGNLTDAKNPNNVVTSYAYDELDRMVKKIENYQPSAQASADVNVATVYEYDLNGNLTKVTNPRGFAATFAYDAANRAITITDAKGNSVAYAYDKVNNRLSVKDRNGNITAKAYDELNRLAQMINAEHHKTLYAYDKVGNLTGMTDPRNAATAYQYDGTNRLTAKIDALNGVTRYEYDPVGNLLAKTDANNHAQRYEYDKVARMIKAINAEDHAAAIAYDANGNPVELTDRNGNVTTLTYDELDRLTLKTDALQGRWQYVYDAVGKLLIETDANGHETLYAFDALNRRLSITDAEGNITTINYDPNGNRIEIVDGNGHPTALTYDELDRLASMTNAENEATAYRYDAEGNRVWLIEADGIVTRYDYDKIYRLIAVVQNMRDKEPEAADVNVDTHYAYDPNGNLIEIQNPNDNATRFEYDPLNRQITEIDALGNTWAYQYDAVGNRTLRVDAKGQRAEYAYYPDDQLQRVSYQNGATIAYTYDPNNNRVGMTDALGASAWTYDALNQVTAVKDALGRQLAMTYDHVGNRTSLTYPDGRAANYAYYKNDWLQALTDPEQGVITYRRDGVGMTTQIVNPNDTFTGMQYDKVNRVLQIANQGKKLNSGFKYAYDDAGQRVRVEASYAWRKPDKLTTDYTYDGLRRLVKSADSEGVWNTYAYDRAGNRLNYATNDDGATNNPKDSLEQRSTYNAINQLLAMTETGKREQTTTFEYDANGNRIRKQWPGPQGPQIQGTQYSYDPENRLIAALNYQGNDSSATPSSPSDRSAPPSAQASSPQNATASSHSLKDATTASHSLDSDATVASHSWIERDITTMEYDGLGRRLVKTHDNKEGNGGAKRVEFTFDGLDPIADDDMWNPQYTNYYRGDGNRIAMRQNFPTGTQGQRYWYHYDALGSVVGLTKQQGQSDHNYPYADYGLIEPQTGNFTAPHNAYTYTGQMWDDNLDVYEFYARAYDPQAGVWLQQDVYRGRRSKPQSLHRYMYANTNPINWIDLFGFIAQELLDLLVDLSTDRNRAGEHYSLSRTTSSSSITVIWDTIEEAGITDPKQQAYILATAQWESNMGVYRTELWNPQNPTEEQKNYDAPGNKLGNIPGSGDGYRFRGRGYVHITGRANYTKYGLQNNPELAADPKKAAHLLVYGMKDGAYTTNCLNDYDYMLNGELYFDEARPIVNTNYAKAIGQIATEYYNTILAYLQAQEEKQKQSFQVESSEQIADGIYVETGTYNGAQYIDLEVNESVARDAYNSGRLKEGTYTTDRMVVEVSVERIEGPNNNRINVTAYSK